MSLTKHFKLAIAVGSMMLLGSEVAAQAKDSVSQPQIKEIQPPIKEMMNEQRGPYNLKRMRLENSDVIQMIKDEYNRGKPVPAKKCIMIKLLLRANNSRVA